MEMTERGPDSAGFAIYHEPVAEGFSRVAVLSRDPVYQRDNLIDEIKLYLSEDSNGEIFYTCPKIVGISVVPPNFRCALKPT